MTRRGAGRTAVAAPSTRTLRAPARSIALPPAPVAVRALAGVAVLVCFLGLSPAQAAIASVGAVALIVISAADVQRRVVPNRIVLPATAAVLALRVLLQPGTVPSCALAALALAAAVLAPRLVRRDALGMGDVKLGLLVGAMLGWAGFAALALAFLAMFPFAVGVLIRRGRAARSAGLPFAPFLAFATLAILLGASLGL
jgi:leader peptidase (prepilin peptidase) / N-methyltransferase